MERERIKKVYVVFKTHLDIGYTGFASEVLKRYVEEYIPKSVLLAKKLNTETNKKFIWTVGSFLIYHYLKNADEDQKKELEQAIQRGDVTWHGLAFTTNTEILDEDLLEYDLSIAKKLDQKFGKNTIAAKMTDVPGHTKAVISHLYENGIQYLHIGVNASSMVPEVPSGFRWKHEGAEVIVQYSSQYGTPCYVEGTDFLLEFVHTTDNAGPQNEADIEKEIQRIQRKYPNAEIIASTLDQYAEELLKYKQLLPVVEEEIGDTWIHGVASDPWKTSCYKALLECKKRWNGDGRMAMLTDAQYNKFMMNLLLVGEHTYGMDYKKFAFDFENWEKSDFERAREKDVTNVSMMGRRNLWMQHEIVDDLKLHREEGAPGAYSLFEQSVLEQRGYIEQAILALPQELREEAEKEIEMLRKDLPHWYSELAEETIRPLQIVKINGWEVCIDGSGALCKLKKNGKNWLKNGVFGRMGYTTYSALDCMNTFYLYNRDFKNTEWWAEADFSKPGLETVETLEYCEYDFSLVEIKKSGNCIKICLKGQEEAREEYGCPDEVSIVYLFDEVIRCRIHWKDKDANRMPEAIWFDAKFDVENPSRIKMKKIGKFISPMDVVKGGSRRHHAVEALVYEGADGAFLVKSIHSPLVSIGGRWMYGNPKTMPDIQQGFSFCLCNNKWGTNAPMWYEGAATYEYEIDIKDIVC